MTMLLVQTCTVLRGAAGTKRHGMAAPDVWSAVLTEVPCRVDFAYRNRPFSDQVSEEFLGREHGFLFARPDSGIQDRDIIVIGATEGHFLDTQYDVKVADPILDGIGIHHMECIISRRDNPVEVT